MTGMDAEALVLELHSKEAVKFGSFKLKSGLTSPIYLDLRVIVSYPTLLAAVADAMWSTLQARFLCARSACASLKNPHHLYLKSRFCCRFNLIPVLLFVCYIET